MFSRRPVMVNILMVMMSRWIYYLGGDSDGIYLDGSVDLEQLRERTFD